MIRAWVRSLWVAANRALIGAPSEIPNSATRCAPTVSSTAVRSSIRCSRVRAPSIGSESPVPGLSNEMTRANLGQPAQGALDRRMLDRGFEMRDEPRHDDEIDRALAEQRIGDVEPAALRVGDLRIHVR